MGCPALEKGENANPIWARAGDVRVAEKTPMLVTQIDRVANPFSDFFAMFQIGYRLSSYPLSLLY